MQDGLDLRRWAESGDPNVPSWIGDEVLSLLDELAGARKVYLLTRGYMDDYSIEGVFTGLEALERGRAILSAERSYDDWNDAEEWELDAVLRLERGPCCSALVDCLTGEGRPEHTTEAVKLRDPTVAELVCFRDLGRWVIRAYSPISASHAAGLASGEAIIWRERHASAPCAYRRRIRLPPRQ